MPKTYNYHDYKAPSPKAIPDDLNELPFKAADKLDPSGKLKEKFLHIQKHKLFGPYNFLCNETGVLKARFEFQSGMCKQFNLAKYYKDGKLVDCEIVDHSHFFQTILNPKLKFSRVDK